MEQNNMYLLKLSAVTRVFVQQSYCRTPPPCHTPHQDIRRQNNNNIGFYLHETETYTRTKRIDSNAIGNT